MPRTKSKTTELSDTDQKLLKAARVLRDAGVISFNPYSGGENYQEPMIYRSRLFSERERAVIRNGLRKPGSGWECVPGGAGLMDELEMVQFEAHGKTLDQIKRTIGR
jgi:hypothetical protein